MKGKKWNVPQKNKMNDNIHLTFKIDLILNHMKI